MMKSNNDVMKAEDVNGKIDEKNMPKFNRYTEERAIRDAQRIYRNTFAGDMATLGREGGRVEGYPFGAVAPFMIDHTGCPVIYTADVAEHTKNAFANGKASLMMRQVERQHQVETGWRLTCAGDLTEITGEDKERVAENYFRFYPEAEKYAAVHDFYFFRLNTVAARVIMSFGKISWVEPKDLAIPSPFTREEETKIIDHMNDDHEAAIKHYLRKLGVEVDDNLTSPRMVGINQFGATIDYAHHLYFIDFDESQLIPVTALHRLAVLAILSSTMCLVPEIN